MDPEVTLKFTGKSITKNGKEYLTTENTRLTFTMSRWVKCAADDHLLRHVITMTFSPQNHLQIGQFIQRWQAARRQHQSVSEWKLEGNIPGGVGIDLRCIFNNHRQRFASGVRQSSVQGAVQREIVGMPMASTPGRLKWFVQQMEWDEGVWMLNKRNTHIAETLSLS